MVLSPNDLLLYTNKFHSNEATDILTKFILSNIPIYFFEHVSSQTTRCIGLKFQNLVIVKKCKSVVCLSTRCPIPHRSGINRVVVVYILWCNSKSLNLFIL